MGAMYLGGSLAIYEGSAALRSTYEGVEAGDVLRQSELARTMETLAADGPDAYYRGPIANAIADTHQAEGGLLTAEDLAAHEGQWVAPLRASYRDVEIAELPPPTQGVTALEALRILDGFPLPADGPDRHHLLIEATKLALQDRDEYVSDPDAMTVTPAEMLADERRAGRRSVIDPQRATMPRPGAAHVGGTAYLCAADGDGVLVSLIQSNFLSFGSGVHVADWGINLNNRGSSFTFDATAVNALAPAKLPLRTLIPAMAMHDGAPRCAFGCMGGDSQAHIHVQLLAHLVDDGADPQDALDAPRWCVEPSNWTLRADRGFGPGWFAALRARGHAPLAAPRADAAAGSANAIQRTAGGYAVATDPRAAGAALGL